jgi:hypothetical protein
VAVYAFVLVALAVLAVALIRVVVHATTVLRLSSEERRLRIELLRIEADDELEGDTAP